MKISREQVEANRARILTEAGRLFRERGIEAVSLAEVMKAAGMTHGGFYNHFASKDALVEAVLGKPPSTAPAWSAAEMQAYADFYLSAGHRQDAGGGCDFAGLGSEAVRLPLETRHGLTERLKVLIDRLAPSAAGDTDSERRQVAIANWASMVGAMVLSRIADDPAFAEEILAATRAKLRLRA